MKCVTLKPITIALDAEASIMETKEIKILSQLGYSDPYRELEA